MDRIVKKSKSCGGVKISDYTVQVYNVCYFQMIWCYSTLPKMASSKLLTGFQRASSVAGMNISATKTETMCLSRQPKQCPLQINGGPLKQSEKFKYLGVSFTSDFRQNSELDIRIGKASAVMRQLHRSVVLKRELCTRAKLSIFRSAYFPILTNGHECWIMNEKVRSQVQASEIGFWRRISSLTLLDTVKSADIRESLNIESLLLRLKRSHLRWCGHVDTIQTNAPGKNSQKTGLFNTDWSKAQRPSQNSMARIR